MRAPLVSGLVALLALSVAPCRAPAIELTASGIAVPFFDPDGKLTHKLVAERGTKSGRLQELERIEIHYFAPGDPLTIIQKVEAEAATWDDRAETLVGRGKVVVATETNRLTGEGFDFALATSLLHIHRDFRMENSEMVVTSDRADVELLVERSGDEVRVRDVKRCDAVGHLEITIQPTATKEYPFTKAFSERAVYDGAAQTITLPDPIRTVLRKGGEGRMNTFRMNLRDPAKPVPAKSPPPSTTTTTRAADVPTRSPR